MYLEQACSHPYCTCIVGNWSLIGHCVSECLPHFHTFPLVFGSAACSHGPKCAQKHDRPVPKPTDPMIWSHEWVCLAANICVKDATSSEKHVITPW